MSEQEFSSDRPIHDKADDVFGRAKFAEQLAKTIQHDQLKDGFVIGLYSPWGYGKTSTLNMVEKYLETNDRIVIVKFNPWLFTDQQTMALSFFETLAQALDKHLETGSEKIGGFLSKYGKALSGLQVDGAIEAVGDLLSSTSLEELKARAEKIITNSGKRLVVIIDDVDRLDKNELFQLFKLIKIAVDFKEVVYLIAFDDGIVSRALSERFPGAAESGQSFIEKIIQVPLHLPLINQRTLDHYVLSGIDKMLEAHKVEIEDDEVNRFRVTFDQYIAGSIETPRMANRYLNALNFVLPLTGEEINVTDLLIVEAVRLVYPEEYKNMRKLKNELSGANISALFDPDKTREEVKKELEDTFKQKPRLFGIMSDLFPLLGARNYGNEKELKKARRIASPDYFDRYFTFGVPMGDVSDVDTLAAIGGATREAVYNSLKQLIEVSSAEAVIKKLRSYGEELKGGSEVVEALADLGDQFPDPVVASFSDTALEGSAMVMVTLIKSMPKTDQVECVKRVITSAKSTQQLAHFVKWLVLESDEKRQEKLFDEEQLNGVLAAVGERVKSEESEKGPLFLSDARLSMYLYHFWAKGVGSRPVREQTAKTISSYDDACAFLAQCTSVWIGSGAPRRGEFDQATYSYMLEIADAEHIYKVLVSEDKKLKGITEFAKFKDGVDKLGNEKDPQFKTTLAQQFAYIHKNASKLEGQVTPGPGL